MLPMFMLLCFAVKLVVVLKGMKEFSLKVTIEVMIQSLQNVR
jgi:hypothetical protein